MLTRLLRQVLGGRPAQAALQPEPLRSLEERALAAGREGDLVRARAFAEKALSVDDRSVTARFCLANILYREDRLDESIAAYRQALAIDPDSAPVHYNLGLALQTRGDTAEAITHYRRTLALIPDLPEEHSTLLFLRNADPQADPLETCAEHVAWAERFADPLTAGACHTHSPEPERALRIGYVSGDFTGHAASSFIAPLFDHHDRDRFSIHGYVNAETVPDADAHPGTRWRSIAGHGDQAVAQIVAADAIDILVDLSGHTNRNRLMLFARRPAPVQITMLGYPNTTGLAAMDYRITDVHADPPGMTERHYRERLLRLPASLWCYAPSALAPEPVAAPCLTSGAVTFGSLAAAYKLNDRVFEAWAAILRSVPQARLVVATIPAGEANQRIRTRLAALGVSPERVEIVPRQPVMDYWKLVQRIDLALDSFPCNGGATTCEALWLGVPTLTLAGKEFRSRAGLSLLTNVGLPELIASNPGDFIERAVTLARSPAQLAQLRGGLRERMRASPILDASGYARGVEALFREAWRARCRAPKAG